MDRGGTLASIQLLRALAATMVVYHHARDRLPAFAEALPSPIGQAGVDLFFVISGFIMTATTWSEAVSPAGFMLRRLVRIVPMYWICTSALAFLILAVPGAVKLQFTISHYVESLLFVPHRNPFDDSVSPLLQPGWTLNYEMFFYCVFAATLLTAPRHRPLLLALIFGGLLLAGVLLAPTDPVLLTYTSPLLLEFLAGTVVGQLYCTGALKPFGAAAGWISISAGATIAILATELILPRPLFEFAEASLRTATYGVAATSIVLGALIVENAAGTVRRMPIRLLLKIGDASYVLYLTHLFSIGVLRFIWTVADFGTSGVLWALAFVAASLVAALALAVALHELIEYPLNRITRKMLHSRLASRAA